MARIPKPKLSHEPMNAVTIFEARQHPIGKVASSLTSDAYSRLLIKSSKILLILSMWIRKSLVYSYTGAKTLL